MILAKKPRPPQERPMEYKSTDPWADWKPQWAEKKRAEKTSPTPHDLQERHAPTRPLSTRQENDARYDTSPHGARYDTSPRGARYDTSPRGARRRITDARLWDAMSFRQQDAASAIASAFEMLGRGLGYAQSNWQRIPGCKGAENVAEAHARMLDAYTLWARECARAKISHAMIVDVLCFGFSCKTVDGDRRQRNGTARENLMKGLSLYCQLQGWR
ncbi:MAG: hypothetical protein KGL10_07325 [Alphaproteobacteria bacterium]|nr:hypothetical protein [Alphaproteobacteria bacterium]MDE2337105.1 hypothetical protein [Alphaproteobacteria bacterium]